jgi:NADH:ubiquinone oxidoreductase subunit K
MNMATSFMAPPPISTLVEKKGNDRVMGLKGIMADRRLKINLLCSCMIWLHSSFNFYLITFYLKSFPGNMYVNSMCFAAADLIAYCSVGIVIKFYMIRQGLAFSFSLSLLSGIIYLAKYDTEVTWLIPALIIFSRIGASMSFNIGYVSVPKLFPT